MKISLKKADSVQCFVSTISPLPTLSPHCVFLACSLCHGDVASELGASGRHVRQPFCSLMRADLCIDPAVDSLVGRVVVAAVVLVEDL